MIPIGAHQVEFPPSTNHKKKTLGCLHGLAKSHQSLDSQGREYWAGELSLVGEILYKGLHPLRY